MTLLYLVPSITGLQSSLHSTYSTEDKLKILAAEVLTHLLDKTDLKLKNQSFSSAIPVILIQIMEALK